MKQTSISADGGSEGGANTKGAEKGSGSGNDDQEENDETGDLSTPVRVIKKKRRDIPAEEKKICLWVLEDGTACGKTFTKFDRYISQ